MTNNEMLITALVLVVVLVLAYHYRSNISSDYKTVASDVSKDMMSGRCPYASKEKMIKKYTPGYVKENFATDISPEEIVQFTVDGSSQNSDYDHQEMITKTETSDAMRERQRNWCGEIKKHNRTLIPADRGEELSYNRGHGIRAFRNTAPEQSPFSLFQTEVDTKSTRANSTRTVI